jgi:Zn-dependent M28 family amino/carboxypeptidase
MRERFLLSLLMIIGAFLGAASAQVTPEEQVAASAIDANRLSAHIRFLSDDLLEGRAPGTRGDEVARQYIAAQYALLGLQPAAADGSYFQRFDILGITSEVPKTMAVTGAGGTSVSLNFYNDFIAFAGKQDSISKVENAEIVFVGYGIVAPEQKWDDYKNVDVRGKILLMMNNDPSSDPKLFEGNRRLYYGRWTYKYEIAAQKGAAGAIIIHTVPSAGYPFQVVQTSWTGEQYEVPAGEGPSIHIKSWTTEEAARKITMLAGKDLDALRAAAEKRNFKPVPLGVTMSLSFKNKIRRLQTANVLGLLPGSDPALSKEVVVYSAHHDHLGVGTAVDGDSIYNGAVDNASGVAAMLSVAHAFTKLSEGPKRSILFAAVAAEESGLLGSKYFCDNPPIAPKYLAANVNIDGINIWGTTRDITYVGFGKSSLDKVVIELAKMQNRIVKGDQLPDRGFFYRSDQFNFAKIGVPAVYFDAGTDFEDRPAGWGMEQIEKWERTDYHQPSDEFDPKWDLSGAVMDAQLQFLVGLRVANAPAMPTWNSGDEFEAARKKALAEK